VGQPRLSRNREGYFQFGSALIEELEGPQFRVVSSTITPGDENHEAQLNVWNDTNRRCIRWEQLIEPRIPSVLGMEGPKHSHDRVVSVDELVNHILKVLLAMPQSEKFFPFPGTDESGVRGSKFFIHELCSPLLTTLV
jgi:hypothetical protein